MNDETAKKGSDYSKSLYLPKTDFPMRASLPQKEPALLRRWQAIDLYRRLREEGQRRAKFVLHDGPPYANGHIHIGHALNKILKDLVTRSQQMLGKDSNYVPGWDCHGLPIEWKIEEEYRAKGKNKDEVPIIEFRRQCRAFAAHWVDVQREEFKRLGVIGDWDHPYETMSYFAEAAIAREIMKFAANGTLYRGSKPVLWSVVEKTALAEAEVEYEDVVSDQVWVKFPLKTDESTRRISDRYLFPKDAGIVIWTTTPWTIPANRATAFNSNLDYVVFDASRHPDSRSLPLSVRDLTSDEIGAAHFSQMTLERYAEEKTKLLKQRNNSIFWSGTKRYVVAKNLYNSFLNAVAADSSTILAEFKGNALKSAVAAHPFAQTIPGYHFDVPLLDGEHVTDDAGTGFVHTAPSHGREDFDIWMAHKAELEAHGIDTRIPSTVDADGFFTKEAPGFEGKRVIDDKGNWGDANAAVIEALTKSGNLVARGRLKHPYPHSWRSKKPLIFRNTPQWFIAMDKPIAFFTNPHPGGARSAVSKGEGSPSFETPAARAPQDEGESGATLRQIALREIAATQWVPPAGENRITGMVASRPDWVVSRQRAWGVPIAIFVRKATNKILVDQRVNARIAAAFEKEGADAWFAEGAAARFLKPDYAPGDYEKIDDVLDVWFDSGSTHAFTLEASVHFPGLAGIDRIRDGGDDEIMYLEGSDQHRGWFQSSLLESCGTRGRAPFDAVLTHGFVLDEKGQKMAKSLGNVVAPQSVIADAGADILRFWVAASDYSEDLRIGPEILKTFGETYRKLRNTIRWMLGTLAHYEAEETVGIADMPELERLMLHRLAELDSEIREAYACFDYKRVVARLSAFLNTDLSAFYFDIRKDALYCDPPSSMKRHAALEAIEQIFRAVILWLAPILVFTCEEAWLARYPKATSVHLEQFPSLPRTWLDPKLAKKWKEVRNIRAVVTEAMEIERAQKKIGSSLEAAPIVYVADDELRSALDGVDFAEVCITSDITIRNETGPPDAYGGRELSVEIRRAQGRKCARSWKISPLVGTDPEFPDVTPRDALALRELKALGLWP
jgi:isoleucyl-tRNA synthetase